MSVGRKAAVAGACLLLLMFMLLANIGVFRNWFGAGRSLWEQGGALFFALQAVGLWAAIWAWSRWQWRILFHLLILSTAVNVGYALTIGEVLTRPAFFWVAAEVRQSSSAAQQFGWSFFLTALAVGGLAAILAALRRLRDAVVGGHHGLATGWRVGALLLLLLPSLLMRVAPLGPVSAERSLYEYAADWIVSPPPPQRGRVDLPMAAVRADAPRHILWVIDESVAAADFEALFGPQVRWMGAVDFRDARSLAHCSAPSHVTLRSGVDVRRAAADMDLRATPSIWAYAKAAGYRTYMIEGQQDGEPQNFLYAPELALIDDYRSALNGLETDRGIAARLNRQLKSDLPSFGYALLRGVHFPYALNAPEGAVDEEASVAALYRAGLRHAKSGFFETLLEGVDRSQVAVIYTSDHGQNLAQPDLPHCSHKPVAAEFAVPLLAFVPERWAAGYRSGQNERRMASQIFAATLIWMGFDRRSVEARYDFDLSQKSARPVRFGRAVIPVAEGAQVDVQPALP
jgi:hypothetical protein